MGNRPPPYIQKRTINPRLVHLVSSYLSERNFDIGTCYDRFGRSFLQPLGEDGAIDFIEFLKLLDVASRKLLDDALGLKIAQRLPFFATGLHHYLVTNAPALGQAVQAAAAYTGLVTNAYATDYEEAGGFAWINFSFREDMGPLTQFVDLQIAALVLRARDLVDDPLLKLRIEFQHPEPHARRDFHEIIGTDLKFNMPVTRVGFAGQDLTRPVPDADPRLFEELQKCARIMLELKQREKDIVARASQLIADFLPSGGATPERIAEELAIGERTLQRELAAASTTFSKVVEDTRKRMALHFLADTELPLTEIAFRLGYSELSAFSRAARGWFGQTPTSIRQNRRLSST
jgi:AraC-like DNA-binding protein